MRKHTLVKLVDKWEEKFPISEREKNWSKPWAKWANKTRKEVIKLTYDLVDEKILKKKVEEMREKELNRWGDSMYHL